MTQGALITTRTHDGTGDLLTEAAGAVCAGTEVLRLPFAVAPLFEAWLDRHYPQKKEKILGRVRALRGGKLNDPRFGSRMRGEGIFADQISRMFHVACRKVGLPEDGPELTGATWVMAETGALWYAAMYLMRGTMLEWMRIWYQRFSPMNVSLMPSSWAGTTTVWTTEKARFVPWAM